MNEINSVCVKLLASWSQLGSTRYVWNATGLCSQALMGKFVIPCTESFGENCPGAHANGEERNRDRASKPFLIGFGTNPSYPVITGEHVRSLRVRGVAGSRLGARKGGV